MIFVTVGTHEQPFDRLIRYVDELKHDGKIEEAVFMQIGHTTYEPRYCEWKKFIAYSDMEKNVSEARIVITHGGPASFIMPLRTGKVPIVVPRQLKFGEHINDHQVDFVMKVSQRLSSIIPVVDIIELGNIISNYDMLSEGIKRNIVSNNEKFCRNFEYLVKQLL